MFIILYFHFVQKKICQSTSGSGVQHNTLLLCFSLVTTEISLKRTAQGNVHLNWSYRIEKLTLCCLFRVEGSVTAEAETVERMYECELVCFYFAVFWLAAMAMGLGKPEPANYVSRSEVVHMGTTRLPIDIRCHVHVSF